MRYIASIICILFFSVGCFAQEKKVLTTTPSVNTEEPDEDVLDDKEYLNGMIPVASYPETTEASGDSLHLPTLDYHGSVPMGYYPRWFAGMWGWDLHQGLNIQLGMSATVGFGKNAPSGVGFSERVSAMWAEPINKHLSYAIGGYVDNMDWGGRSYHSAGLSGVLNYRFNDKFEAYLYAQKNLVGSASGMGPMTMMNPYYDMYGMYGMGTMNGYGMRDCIGGGFRYNFNESTFIQVQFEFSRTPDFFQPRPYPVQPVENTTTQTSNKFGGQR